MLRKLKKRVFRQIDVLRGSYREPKCYNSIKRMFNLCTFRLFGLTLHPKKNTSNTCFIFQNSSS